MLRPLVFSVALLSASSAYADICFLSSNTLAPASAEGHGLLSLEEELAWENRLAEPLEAELSCKERDERVMALTGLAIVLTGISKACKPVPHPGLQITATVTDLSAYALGTIAFVYRMRECKDDEKTVKKALNEACFVLSNQGVLCSDTAWIDELEEEEGDE